MDLNYTIRYLNGDDIEKLEEYLADVTYHDLKLKMFFKFNDTRQIVQISNSEGRTVRVPLSEFIDKTWRKLNIFFKFKDFTLADINKPVKNVLEKYIKKNDKYTPDS